MTSEPSIPADTGEVLSNGRSTPIPGLQPTQESREGGAMLGTTVLAGGALQWSSLPETTHSKQIGA